VSENVKIIYCKVHIYQVMANYLIFRSVIGIGTTSRAAAHTRGVTSSHKVGRTLTRGLHGTRRGSQSPSKTPPVVLRKPRTVQQSWPRKVIFLYNWSTVSLEKKVHVKRDTLLNLFKNIANCKGKMELLFFASHNFS